jgi:quercetin dioxygenase-like cupin family protein
MKPTAFTLGLGVTLGLIVGGIGSQSLNAQQTPVKRTILQKVDLAGMEGKEGVMYVAEIAPGAQAGRHFHPGPEFIYIQEGSMVFESDGETPVTLNPGDSRHIPPKQVHNARNTGSTPTKVVVFLLAEKGQPLATMVDQPVAQQSPAAQTSGAAATGSPASSGAASSGAQPSTSPK